MNQKMSGIGMFFARMRTENFVSAFNHEIYWRIFPHLQREKDHGYSFHSHEEFRSEIAQCESDLYATLATIKQQAGYMGEAYGEGFRYLMYRNLNEHLKLYAREAKRRVKPTTCDPRFVATRA